jgi:C-terminal processing protease CtpA/Prc
MPNRRLALSASRDWQQRNKRIAIAIAERQKSVDAMTRVIVDLQTKNADRHFVITVLREEIEVLDRQIANIRDSSK